MGRTRLFWKLYLTYLLAVALCAGVVGVLAVSAAHSLYHSQARSDLNARAELVRAQAGGVVNEPAKLQPLVERLGATSHTRVTVIAGPYSPIARVGKVLADSQADPAKMENHDTQSRPEVLAALAGGTGDSVRASATLHEEMLYVAIPVVDASNHVVAVVRTALPLTDLNRSVDAMTLRIILGTVLVAVAVAVLGLVVSRRFSSRMREIRRGADRFAAGDFSHEIHVSETDEIGAVASSLNRMAEQLDGTIQTITGERNEREAVLAGMTEGVVAVDGEERVITINAAAGRLLGIAPAEAEGRTLHEVVRNPDLQAFVSSALASDEPLESAIVVYVGQETRDLQAHGSRLTSGDAGAGAVVVLNDMTRLRHFEAVRRDFVANVSHEIKTPVTSIKGFAETLLDGALDDRTDAERFLRIIVGQADRLGAIISDLLSLSNLESGAEGAAVPLERGSVRDVLQVAVEVCAMKASAKTIAVSLSCPDELFAEINPPLLEQAVVNLIDNAIKYSPAGSTVEVSAAVEPAGLCISVEDHGPGIAREHLPRLFERFYRIDKARSRDMGGTGLGLSIVKHIAVAHGGWVAVRSTPGLGSTFSITLPA